MKFFSVLYYFQMLIFFSPSAAIHFLKRDVTDYSAGFFPVTKQKDVCNSPAQYLTSVNKCLSSKPLWQMKLSSAVTIPFTYLSKAGAFTFHYFSRNVSLKKKKSDTDVNKNTHARSKC